MSLSHFELFLSHANKKDLLTPTFTNIRELYPNILSTEDWRVWSNGAQMVFEHLSHRCRGDGVGLLEQYLPL